MRIFYRNRKLQGLCENSRKAAHMTNRGHAFSPDWVSPPGDTIRDLMAERDWSQVELACRLGFSPKHLNQLVKGKAPITEDTALRLERVLGSTANFWLNRETKYREQLARLQAQECYENWVEWLDELPLADLKKAKVIPDERVTTAIKPALVERLLRFFNIASPKEWQSRYGAMQASFRRAKKSQSDVGTIASWLRLGEIKAEQLETPKYDKAKFKRALRQIRELTVLKPQEFDPELRRFCADAGVKLALVQAFPRAHVSGAARWLNGRSPLIQLSLYGKTNDRFWFTFFHEAAHILLHANQKTDIFLDDIGGIGQNSQHEDEANQWAQDLLIPPGRIFEVRNPNSKEEILAFAREINIHPGIVVGRLQHERLLDYGTGLNKLKVNFELVEKTGK